MSKVYIVTDSSAAFTDEEKKNNDFSIIPLQVMIDNVNYLDGKDISSEEFVEKMHASNSVPITSQPSTISFYETYQGILDNDPEAAILSIHIASGLSGTYQTAVTIANEDIFLGKVTVVDSKSTDRGLSFQVLKAVELANEGKDINEIITEITAIQEETKVYLSAENFKNLVAGGRLSKTAGTIATFLNIRVALSFENNKVNVLERGRGQKTLDKFYDGILEKMSKLKEVKGIGISFVDLNDNAKKLKEMVQAKFPNVPLYFQTTAPIISTHVGEGGMALIYYGK